MVIARFVKKPKIKTWKYFVCSHGCFHKKVADILMWSTFNHKMTKLKRSYWGPLPWHLLLCIPYAVWDQRSKISLVRSVLTLQALLALLFELIAFITKDIAPPVGIDGEPLKWEIFFCKLETRYCSENAVNATFVFSKAIMWLLTLPLLPSMCWFDLISNKIGFISHLYFCFLFLLTVLASC